MKKGKFLSIGVATISIVVVIIVIIILNKFINTLPKYENKIVEYDNSYIKKDNEQEFLKYIKSAKYKKNLSIESEEVQNNKLYKYFFMGDSLDDTINLTQKMKKSVVSDAQVYIIPDTNYGNVIYLEESFYAETEEKLYSSYTLIYNEEVNKIYYEVSFENEDMVNRENDVDIEKIESLIQSKLNEIDINIESFSPKVTKEKNIYTLDDIDNKIKIKYDINKNRIISLFWNL